MFDNESVLENFRKINLWNIKFYMEMWWMDLPKNLQKILDEVSINCYWSDWRLEKSNSEVSSIDLLICNEKTEITEKDILDLINEIVEKNKWVIEKTSYLEISEDFEVYEVEDEYRIWESISKLQINPLYIDILNSWDELYKYEKRYYPDRLLDSYNIWWNPDLLEEFKLQMMEDIISKKWKDRISVKFKNQNKKYFQEAYIKWKNHKWDENSYNFDDNSWIIKYDWEKHFWFKHWPIRALQYKITQEFLKLVEEKGDKNVVKEYPHNIKSRLEFLKINSNLLINDDEINEIIELYRYFNNFTDKLRISFKYDKFLDEDIERIEKKWDFKINSKFFKNKIEKFILLFSKIKKYY